MEIFEVLLLALVGTGIVLAFAKAGYHYGKAAGIEQNTAKFKPLLEEQNDILKMLNQENEDLLAKLEKYGKSQCQREPIDWDALMYPSGPSVLTGED